MLNGGPLGACGPPNASVHADWILWMVSQDTSAYITPTTIGTGWRVGAQHSKVSLAKSSCSCKAVKHCMPRSILLLCRACTKTCEIVSTSTVSRRTGQ
ncbi:hypothetical protein J1614_012141 [Plenodomus biglobosus]|nr:hypothetical protein J1614_012141 [Plenodomus biglobosus]